MLDHLELSFSAVVRKNIKNPPEPLEERCCPDQMVGTLGQLKIDGRITQRSAVSARDKHSAVLLIIESPHISEFKGVPGPAKGKTGKELAKHALSVPGLQGWGNAPVVLINAIQYQCSLGKKTALYRDEVFLATWYKFGRSDFIARLKALHQPNDLVVCACTKGGATRKGVSLRQLVYAAIVDALPRETLILRRTHPYSWHSKRNRDSEWVMFDT